MGVPALEVGYTSATTARGDHEVHKGHVVALGERKEKKGKKIKLVFFSKLTHLKLTFLLYIM
jgi:hypothetical protein